MAKKKLKVGVCYFVEWMDAYSGPNSWQAFGEVDETFQEDFLCWTLGWLQKETENYYVFASTVVKRKGQGDVGSVWSIPKGMIVKVEEISYG